MLPALYLLSAIGFASTLPAPRERSFAFEYAVTVNDIPTAAHTVEIWLPAPHDDAFQRIANLRIDTAYRYEIATGTEENRILHIRVTDPKEPAIAVTMRFDAVRKEHIQPLAAASRTNAASRRQPVWSATCGPTAWCRSTTPSAVGRARWWTRPAPGPIWKWRAPSTITWWPP